MATNAEQRERLIVALEAACADAASAFLATDEPAPLRGAHPAARELVESLEDVFRHKILAQPRGAGESGALLGSHDADGVPAARSDACWRLQNAARAARRRPRRAPRPSARASARGPAAHARRRRRRRVDGRAGLGARGGCSSSCSTAARPSARRPARRRGSRANSARPLMHAAAIARARRARRGGVSFELRHLATIPAARRRRQLDDRSAAAAARARACAASRHVGQRPPRGRRVSRGAWPALQGAARPRAAGGRRRPRRAGGCRGRRRRRGQRQRPRRAAEAAFQPTARQPRGAVWVTLNAALWRACAASTTSRFAFAASCGVEDDASCSGTRVAAPAIADEDGRERARSAGG